MDLIDYPDPHPIMINELVLLGAWSKLEWMMLDGLSKVVLVVSQTSYESGNSMVYI